MINTALRAIAPGGSLVWDERQKKWVFIGQRLEDVLKRTTSLGETLAARSDEDKVLRPRRRPQPTARVGKVDVSNASPRRRLASRGSCREDKSLRGSPGGAGP